MILPKDCIMITKDEAVILLQAIGVGPDTGIRDIQGLVADNEHWPQICSLCEAAVRTIYNLLQAVGNLEQATINPCYDCHAYDPMED